ncbi:rhomboid-related protein 1-like [Schistocerca piceifrons]|uniref:rhomboid-related protein 1-like n=1 Tax=Schistocerca piceifrons TaxID=274613 RepID=UPI001F5EBA03|nr:rhomboid-related protein 1-like [Schistocerca piceifrons]
MPVYPERIPDSQQFQQQTMNKILIFFFIIDGSLSENYVFGPVARLFIYNPYRRSEIWRWLTYMFVHVGTTHLIVNVVVQLLLGVPLEMVHGRRRMLAVYSSGIIFGALLTSVFDPVVFLAGASGGVYALLFAHIAAIFLNWSEMKYNTYQVMILTIIILYDFTVAVYYRYYNAGDDKTGYFAHIGGGIAGLLVGFCVLRNLNVLRWEKTVQRACLTIFIASVIIAIIMKCESGKHFSAMAIDNMRRRTSTLHMRLITAYRICNRLQCLFMMQYSATDIPQTVDCPLPLVYNDSCVGHWLSRSFYIFKTSVALYLITEEYCLCIICNDK